MRYSGNLVTSKALFLAAAQTAYLPFMQQSSNTDQQSRRYPTGELRDGQNLEAAEMLVDFWYSCNFSEYEVSAYLITYLLTYLFTGVSLLNLILNYGVNDIHIWLILHTWFQLIKLILFILVIFIFT